MDNNEALTTLQAFVETASDAVQKGVWAAAFLQEGGEPTWDAVKDVAAAARTLRKLSREVGSFDLRYPYITP